VARVNDQMPAELERDSIRLEFLVALSCFGEKSPAVSGFIP